MRKIMAVLLAVAIGLGLLTATATSATAEITCETVLTSYVDGTIREWGNPAEMAQHHFFVKVPLAGFHDLTGMVSTGRAQISVNGQIMTLEAWAGIAPNTWGVSTTWVATHPTEFLSGLWVIRWTQWTDGLGCPIA